MSPSATPAISPPPPTGTTTIDSSGTLTNELERDRRLARDRVRVVVRRHEPQVVIGRTQLERMTLGFLVAVTVMQERDVELFEGVHLLGRRVLGYDDGRGHAEPRGAVRDAEPVVPGRRGDDARTVCRGAGQRDQTSAHLERTRGLQRLELQRDASRQLRRVDERGRRRVRPRSRRLPRRDRPTSACAPLAARSPSHRGRSIRPVATYDPLP